MSGRQRYTWIDGEGWVERPRSVEARMEIIRDETAEFLSMADGKTYQSKSRYRRSLKERGLVELGNDRPDRQPYRGTTDWGRAIAKELGDRGL